MGICVRRCSGSQLVGLPIWVAIGAALLCVVARGATLAIGGRDLVPVLLRIAAVLASVASSRGGGGGGHLAIVVGRHCLVSAVTLRKEASAVILILQDGA